jgi:hypothetical protein
MRRFYFLVLIVFTLDSARAGIVLAPGLSFTTRYESLQTDAQGRELLRFAGGSGVGFEFEYLFSRQLGLNFGALWRRNASEAQYSYQGVLVQDLKTVGSELGAHLGPRYRFIDFQHFRSFLGFGVGLGELKLAYDRQDFAQKQGSTSGLKARESSPLLAAYVELGTEFILSSHHAIRLVARHTRTRTSEFDTLGEKALTLVQNQLALQYMIYFE